MSNITEFFDIDEDKQEIATVEPIVHSDDIKVNTLDDYHASRESMKHMITKGTDMIDTLIQVTKESESPRAYEVLSGYMKNLTEMNRSLIELHKNVKEISEVKEEPTKGESDTYVYIGSTESLQQNLDKHK